MTGIYEGMTDGDDDRAAFDDWDEQDWSRVDEVQTQKDAINAIANPVDRKEAAKRWYAALNGDESPPRGDN